MKAASIYSNNDEFNSCSVENVLLAYKLSSLNGTTVEFMSNFD